MILHIPQFQELSDSLRRLLPKDLPNKCIIIGSSISVKSGFYGEYIDSENAIVVRINTLPKEDYQKYYGRKTDLMISWDEEFLNQLDIPTFRLMLKDFAKKLADYLGYYQLRFTTGLGAIFLLATIFDEIELFGFGWTTPKWTDNSFHYIDGQTFKGLHNLSLEDKIINELQNHFKIYRGEEKHYELYCSNTSEV